MEQESHKYTKRDCSKTWKQYKFWKLATINIRTGREDSKIYEIAKSVYKANLDIVGLQEVKRLNHGEANINVENCSYTFLWNGFKNKREAGVGILIKKCSYIKIENIELISPRLITVEIKMHNLNFKLIVAYAPTEANPDPAKDSFYHDLYNNCQKNKKNQKVIILGDMNATSNITNYNSSFSSKKSIEIAESNNNGDRLLQFISDYNFCLSNTYFRHKPIHCLTWYSPDKKTRKVIDYIICDPWIQRYMTDCRVRNGIYIDTDHRILVATFRTPFTRKARFHCHLQEKRRKAFNYDMLKETETNTNLCKTVNTNLKMIKLQDNANDPSTIHSSIVEAITKSVEESIPIKTRPRKHEIWKGDEILNSQLDNMFKLIKNVKDRHKTQIQKLRKAIKKRKQILINQFYKKEAKEINNCTIQKNSRDLFKKAKAYGSTFEKTSKRSHCNARKLLHHFKQHFNPTCTISEPIELSLIPNSIVELQNNSPPIDCNQPDDPEIQTTLEGLKSYRASTDIYPGVLKSLSKSKQLISKVRLLLNSIWQNERTPIKFGHSKLVPVWKNKGKRTDPSKYRGIQVGSLICKILIIIIINRIREWYEHQLLDIQNGFRQGRGTSDGIYITKQTQLIARKSKKVVYTLLVDLTAAFDHVNRIWLFKSIRNRLQTEERNNKLFNILENLYKNTNAELQNYPDFQFDITSGVRQGGPESPLLFNLYIDYVMRVYFQECKKNKINFLQFNFRILDAARSDKREKKNYKGSDYNYGSLYADDIELFFENKQQLQDGAKLLNKVFKQFGLSINKEKTKTIIFNHPLTEKYPTTICKIDENMIENVEQFHYLGSQISHKDQSTKEVNNRIKSATSAFYQHKSLLRNFDICLQTRMIFFDAFVKSRLTYACETGSITETNLQQFDVCHRKLLRKIIKQGFQRNSKDPEKDDDFKYKITSKQLLKICKTEPISSTIKRQQSKYLAHIIRKPNNCLIKRLTFDNEKIRQCGKPVKSLLANVVDTMSTTTNEFCAMALDRDI